MRVSVRGGPHRGADPRVFARRAVKMLDQLELHAVELSLAFVDDVTIARLNRRWRGISRPTDVLAFAMAAPSGGRTDGEGIPQLLGDVVISVPTARRQAARAPRPLLDELTMLLAHGLLHLLGFDHHTKRQSRDMQRRTAELEAAAARRGRRRSRQRV